MFLYIFIVYLLVKETKQNKNPNVSYLVPKSSHLPLFMHSLTSQCLPNLPLDLLHYYDASYLLMKKLFVLLLRLLLT